MVRLLLVAGVTTAVLLRVQRTFSTALTAALARQDWRAVKHLITAGASVHCRNNDDRYGGMPLHWAARYGQLDLCEFLLANRADIEATNLIGSTALHHAAFSGSTDVAELLLNRGASREAITQRGCTPLHWAAGYGRDDATALLLASGARADARDREGLTALHWTARYGKEGACRLLLATGVDVGAHTSAGDTARDIALDQGHHALAAELLSYTDATISRQLQEGVGK